MKKKTLYLLDNDNGIETKFGLVINLNNLEITIYTKKSEFWEKEYSKEYTIDAEFNLDKLIEEIYLEYLELKSIEIIWSDQLKNMEIIELNLDIEEDDK